MKAFANRLMEPDGMSADRLPEEEIKPKRKLGFAAWNPGEKKPETGGV